LSRRKRTASLAAWSPCLKSLSFIWQAVRLPHARPLSGSCWTTRVKA
jgi:hypothetical protein